MEIKEILSKVDHTLLKPETGWEQIKVICDEAVKYQAASVCIPPSFIARAREYLGEEMTICTVIGFPNGYNTTAVKVFETKDAIANGAAEIDMVINIGDLKDKRYEVIEEEIRQIKNACGEKILKVIIETALLNEEEKKRMSQIVTAAGADFIKTSTGFSTAGATREDVRLLAENVGAEVLVKAAGGISSIEDAEDFIRLGAARLGTSRIIKIVQAEKVEENGY